MIISSSKIETKIELTDARPFLLCAESPKEYYKIVNEFIAAFRGEISEFTFWNGDETISAEKAGEILTEIFSFDLTDKKIISLLHKRLLRDANESDLIYKFQKVKAANEKFILELFALEEFALEYNELTLDALLKICNIRPEKTYQSLLEKIICYLNIFADLKGVCNFVIVGLKNVLDDDDLHSLYHHCRLHKFSLLLLECGKSRPLLAEERAIIITDDLCEIVENFE